MIFEIARSFSNCAVKISIIISFVYYQAAVFTSKLKQMLPVYKRSGKEAMLIAVEYGFCYYVWYHPKMLTPYNACDVKRLTKMV